MSEKSHDQKPVVIWESGASTGASGGEATVSTLPAETGTATAGGSAPVIRIVSSGFGKLPAAVPIGRAGVPASAPQAILKAAA